MILAASRMLAPASIPGRPAPGRGRGRDRVVLHGMEQPWPWLAARVRVRPDRVRPGRAAGRACRSRLPGGTAGFAAGPWRRDVRLCRGGVGLGPVPRPVLDPGQGCGLCPANLVLVHSEPGLVDGLLRAGLALGLVWAALVAAEAVRMTSASPPLVRVDPGRPGRGGVSTARSNGRWLTPCSSVRQDGGKTPAVVDANPGTAI
jgi:hypothetical protein